MTITPDILRPLYVLLVDDDPADRKLSREALKESKLHLIVHEVENGVQALEFLRREGEYSQAPRPDLILLDLNMPRMDGREVLAEIKSDPDLKVIPTVVLTTSQAESDIVGSYDQGANCYVTKPVDLAQFMKVVVTIEDFWFTVVKLPV